MQEAWDALKDERRMLRDMTERKERCKRMVTDNRRSGHTGAGDCTSKESDSEEDIPARMNKRYQMPRDHLRACGIRGP